MKKDTSLKLDKSVDKLIPPSTISTHAKNKSNSNVSDKLSGRSKIKSTKKMIQPDIVINTPLAVNESQKKIENPQFLYRVTKTLHNLEDNTS